MAGNRRKKIVPVPGFCLWSEQKSFLTAVRYIFEGKKKEAVPILLRLATPEKLRQENESNIHSLARKRLRRKYPDYSFLSLARARQNPITEISVISRIRYPYSDTAENSLFLLLALSQQDREAGPEIRKQLEAIGYPYAELYTGGFLNLPLPARLERIRELSRQHPNDPIYAEIQFQIEQQTQDHGSKKELLRILNLLRDNRFPSVLNVFQVIAKRSDFSKQEKLEIFRSIAELIDSDLSIALPALNIYYEPEYTEIILKKTGEFLKNHAKGNTHSEMFYMIIHAHLYHLMSQNRFAELCATLERLCANDVPLSFQEAAGIFRTELSLIAYQTLYQTSDSAFLNYKVSIPDQRIPAAINLLNNSGTWVPCTLDRVPTLYNFILNQLLARKRNPSSGRIRRGAPDVKPIDWNAFRTAVRNSKLPVMLKIAIVNELGEKSEAVEMLKTAIAENRKPDTTFRLNALAFLLQLGETASAERIARILWHSEAVPPLEIPRSGAGEFDRKKCVFLFAAEWILAGSGAKPPLFCRRSGKVPPDHFPLLQQKMPDDIYGGVFPPLRNFPVPELPVRVQIQSPVRLEPVQKPFSAVCIGGPNRSIPCVEPGKLVRKAVPEFPL